MLHTASLWMRVFQLFITCWSRVGEVRGGFWLRGAMVGSGLVLAGGLLLTPQARAADNTQDSVAGPAQMAKARAAAAEALAALHREEEWMLVAKHLPSLESSSGPDLEIAGDVLRARRFPEEAMEYYLAAYRRGAVQEFVLNKMGVTELSLRHPAQARMYFKLAVKRNKKNYDAWNNLGATEYVDGHYAQSVSDYRRALKLNPSSAIFHSNLGTALIGEKDFEDARKEFAAALEIDPEFGTRGSDSMGISAHVLSAEDRARFCLEMARIYAAKGMIGAMLHSLTMALDGGMDLNEVMNSDPLLGKYRKNPQVLTIIANSKAIKKDSLASLVPLEPLPPAKN